MERLIYINGFVNSRNRLLCRFPIYRQIGTREHSINTMRNCNSVAGQNLLVNHIICRQKSAITGGNMHPLPTKFPTRDKTRKFKMLKTNITQVTESSLSQKQQSLKLIRGSNLPKFISEPMQNVKSSKDVMVPLNEEPMLFLPENSKLNIKTNAELMEKFRTSFEKFIRWNPPKEEKFNEKYMEKVGQSMASEELPDTHTEIQREYESEYHTNFTVQKSLNQSLTCYINACISANLIERGYAVLMSIRRRNKYSKYRFKLNDPELYSDLLAKYATLCNWSKVKGIYDILKTEKILITSQVYMNIFDCLGRMEGSDANTALIKKFIDKASAENISLNEIMDKPKFIRDQRSTVLRAIQIVEPSFQPKYTPPQLHYTNHLVETLNENVHSIDIEPQHLLVSQKEYPISNSKCGFSASELSEFTAEQIKNETESFITVKNVTMLDSSKHLNEKIQFHRELFDKQMDQWRADIVNALQQKLNILQHKMKINSMKSMNVYPYMRLLAPEEYADILLDELKSLAENCELYSSTVVQIYGDLGLKVCNKYRMKLREENGINPKVRKLLKTYQEILCSGQCPDNPRQLWQRIVHHSRDTGPCIFQRDVDWPWSVRCDVGRTLFKILLENIKIDANLLNRKCSQVKSVPVVYSIFRNRDLQSREEIRPHPVLIRLMQDAKLDTMNFKTNEVPMLCPPIPWTSADSGGYLHSHTTLLRLPQQFTYQNDLVQKVPPEQLYPPLDSLNQLGTIAWRVNTRILDLAIKVFNSGGNEKLEVPLTPDHMITDEHLKYRGLTKAQFERNRSIKDEKYLQEQNELLSLYTDTLYKLSLANHFRDRPFWLPTNFDFRGRSYPVPPHLTHLSADLTRSMLCFHQKQPLGEHGLDWLKLHCINLTGLKKRVSIQDRLEYANEIIDDIIDSADNPLDGRQWWLSSDDPWQTLATCYEIADAIRSPNPHEFMSGFPIHQDGSCNGLQHYAALGRDTDGAASVNLAPSKVPQDVYTTVANRVEEMRKKDAENGIQVAIELEGLIKRKIVKQTVMTTVYGVTQHGARLQIRKQLKNIDFPSDSLRHASAYLTKKTFESLSEMFSSAREIQDWLTMAAQYISSQGDSHHVEWTSPLGLPIIQPYTRNSKATSNVTVKTVNSEKCVNKVKQKNAFSPNFIHSLDSCHMMLTSLNCEMAGITFVSVHDCFWTHASTVPIMNRICREQFILLHSQPILEDLAQFFYQKYEVDYKAKKSSIAMKTTGRKKTAKKIKDEQNTAKKTKKIEQNFTNLPKKGSFDLNSVLDSTYFFS